MVEPHPGLLELIKRRPGIHVSRISEILGIARTTAISHLERFENNGKIRSYRCGTTRCFHHVDHHPTELDRILPSRRDLMERIYFRKSTGISQTELVQQTKQSPATVSTALKAMAEEGWIKVEPGALNQAHPTRKLVNLFTDES